MPPVVAGIAATLAAITIADVAIFLAVSIAFSFISQALAPKPKRQQSAPDRGITQIIRRSDEPHKIIYGERLVSGVLAFAEISGSSDEFLHFVLALAGHQCQEITTVFLNDVGIDPSEIDGSGNVTSGNFSGKVRIKIHLGLDDQVADADLISAVPDWTSVHQLKGITYIYIRLTFDRDVFPTGIPNVKVLTKGRLVADPRDTAIVITSSSVADPTVILTASPHGLVAGDRAFISGHTGSVPDVIGEYQVLSAPTTTSITVDVNVTTGGTGGSLLQMKWSDNAGLCLRDYILAKFGINEDQADGIDDVASIAAANVCDEEVNLFTSLNTFDFTVDVSTELVTQTTAVGVKPEPLHPLDGVELTTSGILPAGLALATRYFMISTSGKEEPSTFKLASSVVNARAGIAINITDAGTGTHTLTRKSQLRYTINGVISLGDDPINIAPPLIFAMGGILTYTQGKYTMFAGAFNGPATLATFDEDSLRGEISIRPRPGKSEIHNSVRGTFIDRDNRFLPTDFPPIVNATFVTADKEEKIFKDVDFIHVTDTYRAQRLAILMNQRDRQGLTIEYPANLRALEVAVGDVIDVTNSILGMTDKEFEVISWTLAEDGGVDLLLKETASGIYSFNPETDVQILDIAPNTNLPKAFDPPPVPTGLTLVSGTDQLLLQGDGTIISRIQASWTKVPDISVSSGGRIEVQMKKSADIVWSSMPIVGGDETETLLSPVKDGIAYDVRIRSVNRLKVTSAYIIVSNHTVIGKTTPPTDVSTLFVEETSDNTRRFLWTHSGQDIDLAGFRVKANRGQNTAWSSAFGLHTGLITAQSFETLAVNSGTWTIMVKAVDTSGNESDNAAVAVVGLGDAISQNLIQTSDYRSLGFPGTITNGSVDGDGSLLADDTGDFMWATSGILLYSDDDDLMWQDQNAAMFSGDLAEMWTGDDFIMFTQIFPELRYQDTFIPTAEGLFFLEGVAEGGILLFYLRDYPDSMWAGEDTILMWFDSAALMWRRNSSYISYTTRIQALVEPYSIRAVVPSSRTQGRITLLKANLDMPDIVERLDDVVIGSGGTRLTLISGFTVISNIALTVQDDGGSAISARTSDKNVTLGPLIECLNSSGSLVAGTIDVTVQGY